MPELLIELFSEEIPARMQRRATEDLKRLVTDGLVEAGLTYGHAEAFSTPRRLCLVVGELTPESPTKRTERKGPRTDAPEKALEGFLRATGLTRDLLETRDDKKGTVWFATVEEPGRPASEIVTEVLEKTIRTFPWPKSMRWGSGSLRWVRPLQSILCILSDETGSTVVPLTVGAIAASDNTAGHRFMAPEMFSVTGFEDYEARLMKARVILSADARSEAIWHDAQNLAFAQNLEIVEDKALLAEVAGLVEWPVVLMGEIAEDFLSLPPEVLQTSMREHQKFFAVRNPKTGRIERFITVANIETADHGAKILEGNRKVLTARLADANFFWVNDLRVAKGEKMKPWINALASTTFHNQLGSQADRIGRVADLAGNLATATGAKPADAVTAAEIAKADLASEMVYEFPELQGTMGKYYALEAGFKPNIAEAAEAHYSPLGPSDSVPDAPVSVAVALADKLDALTGFWLIDEKPTGSKDPFALRRAALGVIRLVLSNDLRMHLDRHIDAQLLRHEIGRNGATAMESDIAAMKDLLAEIADHGVFGAAWNTVREALQDDEERALFTAVADRVPDLSADLLAFIHERLKVHLREQGIRHDVIDACLARPGSDDLALLVKRAQALAGFLATGDGENLLQGFRRVDSILTQAEAKDGVEYSYGADPKFAETDEEKNLFTALDQAEVALKPLMEKEKFEEAMREIAALRAPVDAFFEAVQVNTDNSVLRRNRLNLLSRIRTICLSVADLTQVEG